jgi:DNA-binding transcriptional ArsR family regulator
VRLSLALGWANQMFLTISAAFTTGLVSRRQKGRYVTYRLSDERVEALLQLADDLLAEVARGVYECVRYNLEANL